MRQNCSCRCGASRLAVAGEPLGRLYCHCTICQDFNKQPYADVTFFAARAVALPDNSPVTFRRYRSPPAIDRGACSACGAPVVEFLAFGPLKLFAIVPSQTFERPSELPNPALHVFYHRRLADATDSLPTVSGYWASEMALSRLVLGGALRGRSA